MSADCRDLPLRSTARNTAEGCGTCLKSYPRPPAFAPWTRYQQFGLRGEVDEQIRRAVRDGFKRRLMSDWGG